MISQAFDSFCLCARLYPVLPFFFSVFNNQHSVCGCQLLGLSPPPADCELLEGRDPVMCSPEWVWRMVGDGQCG